MGIMNIKFSYLYRDVANYKQWHEEVYSNQYNFPIEEIDEFIRNCLIDGEWFYVNEWKLKDLHVYLWDNEIDHTWHEFDSVTETEELATKNEIADFLLNIVI